MDRYMVESPHNHENRTLVIKQDNAMGYLYHIDWAILEANGHNEAKMVVRTVVLCEARALRLVKYGSRVVMEMEDD
jgi:hypothetical protein